MSYLEVFDETFVKVVERESRIDADIYYVSYEVKKSENKRVNNLYLIVRDLLGKVEEIKGSKDKYLVIDDSNKKVLDVFDKLFKFVGAKIDKINSDDNFFGMKASGKITGYDKLRLSTDVELPIDKLIEFHSLTVEVSCVIKKGGKFYPEIYVDEGIFEVDNKMKYLSIKNNGAHYLSVKLVSLVDFNPKKLGVNVVGTEELSIYYVKYDDAPFYLLVDDVKGFIEENSGAKYLTVSFMNKNFMYDSLWKEIGKLCGVVKDFDKDYNVIMFKSDDEVNGMININTMTIIVKCVFKDGANYFPQVCLNYCKYEYSQYTVGKSCRSCRA